jgi:hypothetical protein
MIKRITKIVFLGLAVSSVGLFAQDDNMEVNSKELSMSCSQNGCPNPGECEADRLGIIKCEPRVEEYDYDVYTVGSEESCNECSRKRSCDKSEDRCERPKRNCDTKCTRKGAAKVAQEPQSLN